jgi:DNA-binding PadR family transcriptional regulator
MELNEKEKNILKECDEEGISIKKTQYQKLGVSKEELFKTLKRLQALGFVYFSKDVKMYFATLEGSNELQKNK